MQNHLKKSLVASAIVFAGFGFSSAWADAIAYAYNDLNYFTMTRYAADARAETLDAASPCSGNNCWQPNNSWGIVGQNLAHDSAYGVNSNILGAGQTINQALFNLLGGSRKYGASAGRNSLHGLVARRGAISLTFNLDADPWLYVMTTGGGETAGANLNISINMIKAASPSDKYRWAPFEINGGLAQLVSGSISEGWIGGGVIPLTWTSPSLIASNWTLNVPLNLPMGERAKATTDPMGLDS